MKIFVAGKTNRQKFPSQGYANWLGERTFVKDIKQCDLVLGLGGSDVSAKYYGQKQTELLHSMPDIDRAEYEHFQLAIKHKKPILGICKGSQWAAALSGGAIFQHIEHPTYHRMLTYDGRFLVTNSLHHNMADLTKLKEGTDYKLIAWTNAISPYHVNDQWNDVPCEKEPEVVFYPKVNWLGIQGHPEMIWRFQDLPITMEWFESVFAKFMNGQL